MSQQELLIIAKEILKLNPECSISGSLSLWYQGFKLRRDPVDIDIYCPDPAGILKLPEGGKIIIPSTEEEVEFYNNEEYERTKALYKGVQIDFLCVKSYYVPVLNRVEGDFFVEAKAIIGFKLEHAFGEAYSRFKHRDDLLHILINNVR